MRTCSKNCPGSHPHTRTYVSVPRLRLGVHPPRTSGPDTTTEGISKHITSDDSRPGRPKQRSREHNSARNNSTSCIFFEFTVSDRGHRDRHATLTMRCGCRFRSPPRRLNRRPDPCPPAGHSVRQRTLPQTQRSPPKKTSATPPPSSGTWCARPCPTPDTTPPSHVVLQCRGRGCGVWYEGATSIAQHGGHLSTAPR